LKKKLVIDHCHNTGKVRKLLCTNCNVAIGMFKENPRIMFLAM
jgi:DNA-binding sugar fermentation-stimulating protein